MPSTAQAQDASAEYPTPGSGYSHPANHNKEGYCKSSNLLTQSRQGQEKAREDVTTYNRTAHTDANRKLHLILHGHPHGRDMLGRICLLAITG